MKTDKFQNKYRIPSARAVWHDYNGGEYFVTICTAQRKHYFGEIRNAEMEMNELGYYAVENLKQIKTHYQYCEIPLFVVMPNHIHAIVIINNNPNNGRCRDDVHIVSTGEMDETSGRRLKNGIPNEKMQSISHKRGQLSTSMGGLKRAITCFANDQQIDFGWQERFHDHIIRNQEEMNRIASYIENNVASWGNDKFYTK